MKIKIIFVVVFVVASAISSFLSTKLTSASKNREFARTEKVYQQTIARYADAYETLAGKARYMISQTLTIKKNKKGQVIYVPSSTMEIDRVIESVENIKWPVDSLQFERIKTYTDTSTIDTGNINKTFWQKLKFWED
jgi:hypothetical protein